MAFTGLANAADTNVLVWHKTADRVDADIRGEPLWPLLETIARETGWRIYVEPGTTRNASAKFKDLPSSDALRMLLGDLNFALVPRTNTPPHLYVFRTVMQNATRLVRAAAAPAKHVPNELLVKLKPGVNIDDLAKLLGAKVVGRMDKRGVYLLQFGDATATDIALGKLQNNSDVAEVDYNYYFDPLPPIQSLASGSVPPLSLMLNPPPDSGKVIVGLIDTSVQSLGPSLDKFILKQLSEAGDAPANSTDITHGTAMAYTILAAIAAAEHGGSSVQIQPVDVYGSNPATTSWDVALGIQAAVNNGATVLNLSLSGSGDSSILDSVIKAAVGDGILIFAASGNQPISSPTYPAASPGVIPVTALGQPGQLAPYANVWSDPNMLAMPGASTVPFGNLTFYVQGTSVSTANATGVAAGNADAHHMTWSQIEPAMQKKFAVPAK
ncbi:MAG: S8 family serine peptidase [Verrucomicrobiota bacterium]